MTSTQETMEEVLTTREAAQFLKVSELTVRKMIREGSLPAHRMGRKWAFLRSELVAWLKSL